jgi:hypothetical protein
MFIYLRMMFEGPGSGVPGSGGIHHEMEDRKPKVKSAFGRQKTVETGLVRDVCSLAWLLASDGGVWIGSSVKSFSRVLGRVSGVAFERGSSLEKVWDAGFRGSGLQSIVVPSSVVALGKESFYECKSLESVTFESDSRLERIEGSAFEKSGLLSIEIPFSVAFIDGSAFLATEVEGK